MKNGEDTFSGFSLDDLLITDDVDTNKANESNTDDTTDNGVNDLPIEQQLIDINDSNTQESDNEENTGSSSSSPELSTLVTTLGEELGITIDNAELEKAEDKAQFLRDMLNKHVEDKVKANLSDEEKEALETIRTGVSPKEVAATKVNQKTYASLKNEDVKENVKLQEALIINSYITKGLSQEEAVEMLATLTEDKKIEKAFDAKKFMIEKEKQHENTLKEKAKLENETKTQKVKDELQKVESFVMAQKEYIPGLELTDVFKKDIYKTMTTSVVKDDRGNQLNDVYATRAKNPVEWEFRLTLLHKLGLFNEKPDFSKFQKVAETKTAKGLEKLLQEGSGFMQNGKSKSASTDELGLGVFRG